MSSIGKRVAEAMEKMAAQDAEGALFQICSALGSTADREYAKKGGKTYRDFLHDNLGLITRVGLGAPILNLHLGNFSHPDIKPDANGRCTVEQILYHAVRCGLYHEGKLPDDLSGDTGTGPITGRNWTRPASEPPRHEPPLTAIIIKVIQGYQI